MILSIHLYYGRMINEICYDLDMKHIIVGTLNLFFGLGFTLGLIFSLYTLLFQSSEIKNLFTALLTVLVVLIFVLANLISGFMQFTQNKQKYFNLAFCCFIINFLLYGFGLLKYFKATGSACC